MSPRVLFSNNAAVERQEPPPLGPTIKTWQAKKAKQNCPTPAAEASTSTAKDSVLAKLLALEERFERMTESNLNMQASL